MVDKYGDFVLKRIFKLAGNLLKNGKLMHLNLLRKYLQEKLPIFIPLGKITSREYPEDVPNNVLWTSIYGLLCNAKEHPLRTSWGCPLPASLGHWNMTSWGRLNVTSWGSPQTVLYVTPWNVLYQYFEDVSCKRYVDVPIRSNIYLLGTCPTDGWQIRKFRCKEYI